MKFFLKYQLSSLSFIFIIIDILKFIIDVVIIIDWRMAKLVINQRDYFWSANYHLYWLDHLEKYWLAYVETDIE